MKDNMEAMKEQMATMMEAIMSMNKIMKVNATAVAAISVVAEMDQTPPSGLNQINHPTSNMYRRPHFVQVQNKHAFPPYGLPPNYTPPNVAHTPDENVNNSTPILIESQQPQSDHAHVSQPMGETHEIPHHNLVNFEPCLGYATKEQAVGGVPLPNTLEGPQFRPQPQPQPLWRDLAAQVATPMMEREMITIIVDTLPMFYYEKMVGYTPSSFVDLVFTGERIEVGLKRDKFDHPASMNRKPGANGENEKEGGTHVVIAIPTWPNFPPAQQCQYSANISPSHYPPPYQPKTLNHPQRPPLNHPIPNTTLNTNQNTNQGRNFATKSLVPQPPFFRGYDSNATCAYHGGVSGHFIEHCMTLKRKVQSLINADWLKFEGNRL
ncbi:hypothetical protein GmHk_U059503 [Glycine max]|nr:hypothetical protein GmHk_U059503 [Glycine max]